MNKQTINHTILELLKELKYLSGELKNDSTNTSQLELDLMKEKIRRIYEDLDDINFGKQIDKEKEVEPITPPVPQENIDDVEDQEPEETPEVVFEIEEEVQKEAETSSQEKIEEETLVSPKAEKTLDLFEEPTRKEETNDYKSVGEKIAEEKPVESIGETIQSKKIVTLKLAIGINEKFFFLNELFEGKMNEYNEAIELLDQKESFRDAMENLVLLKEDKIWDEEGEAFVQLKGFLERKFN